MKLFKTITLSSAAAAVLFTSTLAHACERKPLSFVNMYTQNAGYGRIAVINPNHYAIRVHFDLEGRKDPTAWVPANSVLTRSANRLRAVTAC